jgi:hypothetical protein
MLQWLPKAILFLLLWGAFSACSSSFLSRNKATNSYSEDLSKFRPRYEYVDKFVESKATPEGVSSKSTVNETTAHAGKSASVDKELATILQTINQQNKAVKFMPGFRIQIYVGNIRSEADGAKAYVYRNFPDMSPYITFSQPTYRVKIGDFMTKSEAEQVLSSIKQQYPTSVIIADKIEIEKGLLQAIAEK